MFSATVPVQINVFKGLLPESNNLSFDLVPLNWYNFALTVHELLCQWMVARLDMG